LAINGIGRIWAHAYVLLKEVLSIDTLNLAINKEGYEIKKNTINNDNNI
jgi:hypothetical protein